jgi:hypothetical protein
MKRERIAHVGSRAQREQLNHDAALVRQAERHVAGCATCQPHHAEHSRVAGQRPARHPRRREECRAANRLAYMDRMTQLVRDSMPSIAEVNERLYGNAPFIDFIEGR